MFAEELTLSSENQMSPETVAPEMTVIESVGLTSQTQGSSAEQQDIVALVEAQLSQSDVYCRAIASLQQVTAEQGIDGQILLKAVSLEAIRLTVEALSQQSSSQESLSQDATSAIAIDGIANEADDIAVEQEMFAAIEAVMQPNAKADNPLVSLLNQYKAKRQAAVAAEIMLTREELLTQLGEQIALLREERGLSIAQLHARTFIPMYHLQALEGGHVEQLPEDIYLRGFLRRIENALNLETGALTDKMPNEVAASVIPDWYHRSQKAKRKSFAGLDVNPSHLYMTYAAIMAGGVCWLSNQTAPKAALPDLSNYEPRTQANANWPDRLSQASQTNPQSYAARSNPSQGGVKIGAASNVAPPEMVR